MNMFLNTFDLIFSSVLYHFLGPTLLSLQVLVTL